MSEFKYPMWFKNKVTGSVVEFTSLKTGIFVIANSSAYNVGDTSETFINHTDTEYWEDVTDQYKDKAEIPPLKMCGTPCSVEEKGHNNGGSTDYYKLKQEWKDCADIMEDRAMNYNQGNIFKSAFCFNVGRHNGTDYERELNKIIYFAERELKRIKNVEA